MSLSVHASLIGVLTSGPARPGGDTARHAALITARLLTAASTDDLRGNEPEREAEVGASPPPEASLQGTPVRTLETPPLAAAPGEQPPAELATSSPPGPALEAPVVHSAGSARAGDEFDGYVPRPLLTVPPVLRSSVLLAWPEDIKLADGRYAAVLSLFIDEAGIVRRVEVEDADLPAALEDVARSAFLNARFEPGQVDGSIVKSRIRIAVEFESRPSAASRRF
ncbi:energy transducer TonB [Ideonella sp. BN130291]|uniref:energy transducer TonB n=1 Tax=Ideonella sp. BN130291 TaxID=3112940 RepID=UPI002E2532AA